MSGFTIQLGTSNIENFSLAVGLYCKVELDEAAGTGNAVIFTQHFAKNANDLEKQVVLGLLGVGKHCRIPNAERETIHYAEDQFTMNIGWRIVNQTEQVSGQELVIRYTLAKGL